MFVSKDMDSILASQFRANSKNNEVNRHPTRIRIFDRRRKAIMIARSVLLFVIISSFLWIGSILRHSAAISTVDRLPIDGQMSFPMLFQDLANVGLLTPGDRAVLLGQGDCQHVLISGDLDLHLISGTDDQRSRSFHDNTLDFVFSHGLDAFTEEFIAGALKIGGIAAVQVTDDMSDSFRIPLDFKIVYLRRLDPIVLAMRKIGRAAGAAALTGQRRRSLLAEDSTKRGAVEGLEDLLLEPPHVAAVRRHRYGRRTKYLPDLTGDSLDQYARRVFVNVESSGYNGGGRRWFEENYPTKGRRFEMYEVEAVAVASASVGMSEWLRRNVGEEEYVVMKAEAEVVEEIFSSKAIFLVDELFMECRHEGQNGRKKSKNKNTSSKRAYWECLYLYGKLRDEGIAVHQWWG